jgi:hypothetical protein
MHRFVEHRAEYWGELTRRGVDNAQYLGGRGLLFSGVREFALEGVTLGCAFVQSPP